MFDGLDPLDLWKVGSIALTGSFGVLGLLTEYKHPETKKVTIWGKRPLQQRIRRCRFNRYSGY